MRGRGRSSSKQGSSKVEKVEIDDKLDHKLKEEPHLSGAHIRSLVKHLTSPRTIDPMISKNLPDSDLVLDRDGCQNIYKIGETREPQPPQQQHKKQVRRRLHTTRPYQERLLNMAEARREIVTALKFHRASMKKANEQQQQEEPTPQTHPQLLQKPSPQRAQEANSQSRKNTRIYSFNTTSTPTNFNNYLQNFSYQSFPYNHLQNSHSWPMPLSAPMPLQENFNLTLPKQTLGLNLNLNNLDTIFYHNPSTYSLSSPSTSSSPPLSISTDDIPYLPMPQDPTVEEISGTTNGIDVGLHHAMDDDEMAEIRSLGEQHQIEWSDTVNLVTSAWWSKFLKNMEIQKDPIKAEIDNMYRPFDEVMEFPSWLNANDNSYLQQLDNHYSDDYFQDPALPCMDIEEIEGMDGEWLA